MSNSIVCFMAATASIWATKFAKDCWALVLYFNLFIFVVFCAWVFEGNLSDEYHENYPFLIDSIYADLDFRYASLGTTLTRLHTQSPLGFHSNRDSNINSKKKKAKDLPNTKVVSTRVLFAFVVPTTTHIAIHKLTHTQ